MRRSLGIKLAVPLLATLALGFGTLLVASLRAQSAHLRAQAQKRTEAVAEVFSANLRTVMLTGDGVLLDRLLSELRSLKSHGAGGDQDRRLFEELRLFDPDGREVYPDRSPLLASEKERQRVREQLKGGARVRSDSLDAGIGSRPSLHVLPNEPSCRPCHPSGENRGALLLATHLGATAGSTGKAEGSAAAVARAVALGIRQAMLSQRATSAPQLLADLEGAPDLAAVQVFRPDGRLRYAAGDPAPSAVATRAVRTAARTGRSAAWTEARPDGIYRAALTALSNDRLCHACHPAGDRTRGAVVAIVKEDGEDAARVNRLLAAALVAGVRNVMLSGKGGAVQRYVDGFRRLPWVERLHVFNPDAREVYAGARGTPAPAPPELARLLQEGGAWSREDPMRRALVRLHALPNEEACRRCHGGEHALRGVVMSSVSLRGIDHDIAASRWHSLAGFALTMLLVCLVLLVFVTGTVVRPIRRIGGVAERVGEGDLRVRAEVGSRDEIGQLAERMNGMIEGLRARMLMEKFVPPSAVALIERSADADQVALGGERQEVTVLFSDIRGFTTFSEQAEPEEVVRLVNDSLHEQARLIREHGGEVDKYLGDAAMAIFTGPTMAHDAVRCGLAIRAALAGGAGAPGRTVGIGINTGWVVRGTIGSPERMEYTALGDAVNVAKRLCDAAGPGEVLVSAATYEQAREAIPAEALTPLSVKGRRQAVAVYRLLT
jgi:class 3 adenylate cyclase